MDIVPMYYRKKVFTPFNVIQQMNLTGGTMNYEALEVLHRIESNGKKYSRGILPSSGSCKQAATKVEALGCSMLLSSISIQRVVKQYSLTML
jgi:hypothetical protein